jgi:soluble lytic murein transglycosylase-like protein
MVLAGILVLPNAVPAAANGAAEIAKGGSVSLDRSELRQLINQVSLEYGVDPKLVDALVRVESSYDPRAVSRKGAMGLMQLMPDTADRLEVEDPFDPEDNVRGGVKEFSRLLERYAGNLQLALAAYNAGEGAVARYRGVPPYNETRNYVSRILTLYTGRPFRLAGTYRAKPVRMVRDRNGNTVITNVSSTSTSVTASIRASTLGGDGPLRGGFGSSN